MRWLAALSALCAYGFTATAQAAPVTLAPISFSPEFQQELSDELGVREGDVLRDAVQRAVTSALADRGLTDASMPLSIEIAIVDADPNRPTFEQLSATPGLSYMDSVSIGGAELHAVIRGADGAVLDEVDHRRYNYALDELVFTPDTWSEARRAIRRFATKVADATAAHAR